MYFIFNSLLYHEYCGIGILKTSKLDNSVDYSIAHIHYPCLLAFTVNYLKSY